MVAESHSGSVNENSSFFHMRGELTNEDSSRVGGAEMEPDSAIGHHHANEGKRTDDQTCNEG